jgi:hypothetical protein
VKLDRNLPNNKGRGKYAVVKMREVARIQSDSMSNDAIRLEQAMTELERLGVIDYGTVGTAD